MSGPSAAHLVRCLQGTLALPLAKACELTLVRQEPGAAETLLTVTEEASAGSGQLHGTYMYALLDITAYLAVVTLLPDDVAAVSHDAHFSLLGTAPRGAEVTLRASVVRKGRSVAFLRCEALRASDDGEAQVIALATITKTLLPMAVRMRDAGTPTT